MAWIETYVVKNVKDKRKVATREGGVDRNKVDGYELMYPGDVATREGGVDRNVPVVCHIGYCHMSPPARVAWIETFLVECVFYIGAVATREGGVDRNMFLGQLSMSSPKSPPARVAWIKTQVVQHRVILL